MSGLASVLFITHPRSSVPRCRCGVVSIAAWRGAHGAAWCGDSGAAPGAERRSRARSCTRTTLGDRLSAPAEFEATADRFFAEPLVRVRGWERAIDAQARIVACVREIVAADRSPGDLGLVAHGGVGALLLCHLAGQPIDRRFDPPGMGGGNLFAFDCRGLALLHGWRPIEGAG